MIFVRGVVFGSIIIALAMAQNGMINYRSVTVDGAAPEYAYRYERKIAHESSSKGDYFGMSVSLSGDKILIGSLKGSVEGENSGIANLYALVDSYPGWKLINEFYPYTHIENEIFGSSTGLSDNWAVIGAWKDNVYNLNTRRGGSVTIFRKTSDYFYGGVEMWDYNIKYFSKSENDLFGYSLLVYETASDECIVFVGAPGGASSSGVMHFGYVTMYQYTSMYGWILIANIAPANSYTPLYFGGSLSFHRETLAVGASDHKFLKSSTTAGKVYVFSLVDTFLIEEAVLQSPLNRQYSSADEFGASVAVWNSVLAVSQPSTSGDITSGSVFIYKKKMQVTGQYAWIQQQIISPVAAACDNCNFGWTIALNNNNLFVGSQKSGGQVTSRSTSSSVWYFQMKSSTNGVLFEENMKFSASDSSLSDSYGSIISFDGNTLAIGASTGNGYKDGTGVVYIYTASLPQLIVDSHIGIVSLVYQILMYVAATIVIFAAASGMIVALPHLKRFVSKIAKICSSFCGSI